MTNKQGKKVKYIKLKDRLAFISTLQHYIIAPTISNAGLISLGLHFAVRKFAKELETIALSEELQVAPKQKGKK